MTETSFGKRRFDRAAPRAPAKAAQAPPILAPADRRPAAVQAPAKYLGPVCTIGILAMLILIFVLQEAQALGAGSAAYGFNYRSLLAFGADSLSLVRQGQWWRMLTAPMLHANPGHLIGNGIVLALVGLRFERLVGWGWFLAVYFVSALGGELVSIHSLDPDMIGLGASGAIMGLLSAMLVCSFHPAAKGKQIQMRWLALRVMIPALLPLGGNGGEHAGLVVNYSAHAGGAMAGVAMGLLINALWPQGEPRPVAAIIAEWLGVVGIFATVAAFLMVALRYPAYQAVNLTLAPDAQIPRDQTQAIAAADDLVVRFPKDPRIRLYVALGDGKVGLYGPAADQLRIALGQTEQLSELPPQTGPMLNFALALDLLAEGDKAGALAAAAPACRYHFANSKTTEALTRYGLCGPLEGVNDGG